MLTGTRLTVGVNALDLSVLDDGLDVAAFSGARSGQGSFADYVGVINNPANWIAQDASGDQSADGKAPDVPFSATAFIVGAATPSPATEFGGIKILSMAQSLEWYVATPVANESINVVRKGGYVSSDGLGGAESIAFDPTLDRAFVTNGARDRIDILDLSNPAAPEKIGFLDLPGSVPGFSYGGANAVAVNNGLVAVALQNADGCEKGVVALFNGATGAFVKAIEVDVLPDHLTFNPGGSLLIVGNEGQPFLDLNTGSVDNAGGSVTIISIPSNPADAAVRNTVGFTALDALEKELDALGLKTYDGGTLTVSVGALNATINVAAPTVSQDIEPEYIAVSPDGTRAFVISVGSAPNLPIT